MKWVLLFCCLDNKYSWANEESISFLFLITELLLFEDLSKDSLLALGFWGLGELLPTTPWCTEANCEELRASGRASIKCLGMTCGVEVDFFCKFCFSEYCSSFVSSGVLEPSRSLRTRARLF